METLIHSDFEKISTARQHRTDRYAYEKFTEESAPDMAKSAQRVHAEGYQSMGFVKENAVADDGTLSSEIDKARGAQVEYYAGIDLTDQESATEGVVVTLRKVGIPEGGTVEDLPAYKLCEATINDVDKNYLLGLSQPDKRIKEIGALARVEDSNPLATLELLRNVHQEALGNGEIWFFSIVKETYQALEDNFGTPAIRRLGEGVKIDDERVGEKVELVPAIVDVENLLHNMITAMKDEENRAHRNRIFRTILFFSDGLEDSEMTDEIRELRNDFFKKMNRAA